MNCPNYIKIGSSLSIDITRVSDNTPVDITGHSIESFIKHPKFGRYELDVEIINASEGRIKLSMDADVTSRLLPGNYSWDMSFTDPNGVVEIFPKKDDLILTFIKGSTV